MGFVQSLDPRAASHYGACSGRRSVYPSVKSIACIFLCFLFATLVAHAQGVGSSGEISGTVSDASGGVLPKATISVVDTQTGLKRTAVTNGTGQFRVVGLSPATYDISAQMAGFATEIRRGIPVAIGQTVTSDFKMKPSQVATVVEVTDQPPVVETERGSQADRISQQYIADLPIDRRDYLTFTLLAPGVSDSSRQRWRAADGKPGRCAGIPNQSQQLRRRPGIGHWRFHQYRDQVRHRQYPWHSVWFLPQRCPGRG
jgi:Carboxypeptidase regulatory-like domain